MAWREDIPAGNPAEGCPVAVPGAVLAAKAALYEDLREQRLSKIAFAVAMGIQESEVRRTLGNNLARATCFDWRDWPS